MRKLLDILAKRFPPKLTVTEKDWTDLRQEVAVNTANIGNTIPDLNRRLQQLERTVENLAQMQGYVKGSKGSFGVLER